jgi:UDP-2-acetamido-2,6-beta-L-arabino-hexul-4-ose reductase
MKKIVITGANGFIGKNLLAHLQFGEKLPVETITREDAEADRIKKLRDADVVFHLAGVNRPNDVAEFDTVNTAFTQWVVKTMESLGKPYKLVYTSSAQATLDNPYGKSKLAGEQALQSLIKHGECIIYRLPGVFGKWCRPNYNSVVATYCFNIANGKPIEVRDPAFGLTLVYVDDVVSAFLNELDKPVQQGKVEFSDIPVKYSITLGELAEVLQSFKNNRTSLMLSAVGKPLQKALYSTYLSYLPTDGFSYPLTLRTDDRGSLYELLKSDGAGQIFLSTTFPGITRGNHFHHTKVEKFVVIHGEGIIQFRQIDGQEIIDYPVSGDQPTVVDIPPGYTHNITNTGKDVMITLFWANEVFDPGTPDTYFLKV